MTTRPQYQEEFARLNDEPATSLERLFVNLTRNNFIRKGSPGGRSGSVHMEAEEFVYPWFGIAAPRPSEGSRAVQQFDPLPYRGSVPKNLPAPGGHHLGSTLVNHLQTIAGPFSKGQLLTPESEAMVSSWELTLCFDPLFAQIKMNDGSGPVAYFFHADAIRPRPIRHLTILSGEVLLVTGKLLADTYIHQNAIAAVKFLDDTKPGKANQKKEKAGHILQDAPGSI